MADRPLPDADAIADALSAAHGIDPRGSLALRARFDLALAEVGDTEPSPALLARIAERLRVGETRFYRDPEQLDVLAREFLPRAVEAGKLRALSAGCSTGEEAWTLAAMIEEARGERTLAWEVVGIDAVPASVEHARRGTYAGSAVRAMPRKLARFFVAEGDAMRAAPALASRCRFSAGDLLAAPLLGPYALVVCRNVLIYLEEGAARRLLERLSSQLADGGVLVVARAEVAIARRAGLQPIELGRSRTVVFGRAATPSLAPPTPPRPSAEPSRDSEAPPSRVALEIDGLAGIDGLVARGQALLSAGAPTIELRVAPRLPPAQLVAMASHLRRLVAAANALGARCVAADEASARAFAAAGLALGDR